MHMHHVQCTGTAVLHGQGLAETLLRAPQALCCMQDEISEMKRKFKIMSHQIEQLKEEIAAKDLALVKEHFDHMKVNASGIEHVVLGPLSLNPAVSP